MESAITVKGQATIPKAILEYLGLKPGDRLKFFLHPDGSVVLLPKVSARTLRGILNALRKSPRLARLLKHSATKPQPKQKQNQKA